MEDLLNINISDSELDSPEPPSKPSRRTDQTEEEFQLIRSTFTAKVENGNIYKDVILPLGKDFNKQHVQQIIHAVEELYFFKRFQEATEFVDTVLGSGEVDQELRVVLDGYKTRCEAKMAR